jgi:GNAT superfamily N-acetyltransferase
MDPSISIAPAREDQVPLILELIRGLAEYEKLADEVVATEELLRRSLFGAGRDAEVVIAYVDDQPAGFALFFHNYSTFLGRRGLYLEDLFVKPAFRGHGVGRRLLKHLARLAVERGCGRFEWWVLDWNAPAIRFYQGLGARPMSDWTVYRLTDDALAKLAGGAAAHGPSADRS